MALPAAVVSFLPLLKAYRVTVGGTGFGFNDRFSAEWFQIPDFYHYVLYPCLLMVLGAFVLFAVERAGGLSAVRGRVDGAGITLPDAVLLCCFWAIPVYGLLLAEAQKDLSLRATL